MNRSVDPGDLAGAAGVAKPVDVPVNMIERSGADAAERADAAKSDIRSRPLIRSRWIYFLVVVLFDSLLGAISVHMAVHFRYDFLNRPPPNDIEAVSAYVAFAVCALVWTLSPVPRAIWRYLSLNDFVKLARTAAIAMVLLPLAMFLFVNRGVDFPRLAPFIALPLFLAFLLASRLGLLVFRNGDVRAAFRKRRAELPDAVLVGSPGALHNSVRDMSRRRGGASLNVVGLIDSSSNSAGRSIRGVPVIGTLDDLGAAYSSFATRFDTPPRLVAVDTHDRSRSKRLVRIAAEVGAPLSRVSSVGGGKSGELTEFEAQDLIGRKARSLDITPVRKLIEGRRVLITGAGGSIGSELTRQVARLGPARLALVDQSEFALYTIDREVASVLDDGRWDALIADVTDTVRMTDIFARIRPEIVLHAAALKHVPLGEANPLQTLHTNVEGTRLMLQLSAEHGVRAFTLVSTDKAVNISNVMGASKNIAERLTHAFDTAHPDMAACAVRFGNVLASNGSVIPLFDEQIAAGGPVTVTHRDATRYFMTTEEAAALVLQATALDASSTGQDSSIYVLEMGDPVNIASLARQLIRLRGKVPDRDIEIVYTGLRPGEVLEERVVGGPECLETTYVRGLLRITGIAYDPAKVPGHVDGLLRAVRARNFRAVRKSLAKLLPDFSPTDSLSPPR